MACSVLNGAKTFSGAMVGEAMYDRNLWPPTEIHQKTPVARLARRRERADSLGSGVGPAAGGPAPIAWPQAAVAAVEMFMQDVLLFLGQAAVISLSGVMAPGAVTAAALAAGTRNRHAGSLIAVGHGIVEFPLMFVIVAGAGAAFRLPEVRIGIGLVGGLFMVLMGVQMARGLRRPQETAATGTAHGPVVAGIILSGGNPYFLLWWATVGLALATQAYGLGAAAFGLFAAVHWLCDLGWLELLSQASFRGTRLLKGWAQPIVLGLCAAAMVAFGGRFLYLAGLEWAGRL